MEGILKLKMEKEWSKLRDNEKYAEKSNNNLINN